MTYDLAIPFEQGFNLIIECLKGFEILFKKFGAFHIGSSNIFFNSHHQPKVWISSDLGKTKI